MNKPSRILASATAVLLLAAVRPAAAAPLATSPTSADLPIPGILYAILRSAPDPIPRILDMMLRPGPDPVCDEARQSTQSPALLDQWRQWWSAATSRRGGRHAHPERPTRPPFYLRSPMLSGFFGWGEPNGCDDGRPGRRTTSPRRAPAALRPSNDSAEISRAPHPW